MSITDELREWMLYHEPASLDGLNIADRIDERVNNIRLNEHHKGYRVGRWYMHVGLRLLRLR